MTNYECVFVALVIVHAKRMFSAPHYTVYCHLWSIWLNHIFPHYLINAMIFGKKLQNIKYVLIFSEFLCEIFLILRRNQRDVIIGYNISNKMQRYTVYLETALHISGGTSTHHQERKQLYIQHLVFVTPIILPAADSGR